MQYSSKDGNITIRRQMIYIPNLKLLIQKIINNCDIYGYIYELEIIFLTLLDSFSKFFPAYYLEDRSTHTIIEIMSLFKPQKGNFSMLITDNVIQSINKKK